MLMYIYIFFYNFYVCSLRHHFSCIRTLSLCEQRKTHRFFFSCIDSSTKICMNGPAHYAQTTFGARDKKTPPGTYFLFNFPSYLVCLWYAIQFVSREPFISIWLLSPPVAIVLLTVFVDSGILLTLMHIFAQALIFSVHSRLQKTSTCELYVYSFCVFERITVGFF